MSFRTPNQPPPLTDYNLFLADRPLQESLKREGGEWISPRAIDFGAILGTRHTLALGDLANRHEPELRTHDRYGDRIDQVVYHPAYHDLMRLSLQYGTHSLAWTDSRPGAHVARAALMMLRHQVDEGHGCPISMTYSAIPSLRLQPELAAEWEPLATSSFYDPRFQPLTQKSGVLFGMAMTERQGGSDVRANTTQAAPLRASGPGQEYQITGHKWFCSAPMCDAFLVLAQAPAGLSCFLLPRFKPDGTPNAFHIQRLKDKLGNRSNASSEVEFNGAWSRMVGEEGRGVPSIIEMVRHTRLDCVLGAASTMRRAVAEATHHAHYRHAFGKALDQQPLMRNVLADLCLESEAATAFALRLARSFDEAAQGDAVARPFNRIATAIGKFWVSKRVVAVVAEAMECLGGNGYVEEAPLARLYRDAPLNSIWEGSGNIQCLDVLRTMGKEPDAVHALLEELRGARGLAKAYDQLLGDLEPRIVAVSRDPGNAEFSARRMVEDLAIALQGSILLRHSSSDAVRDAFCQSRLGPGRRSVFGSFEESQDAGGAASIIERARPRLARD